MSTIKQGTGSRKKLDELRHQRTRESRLRADLLDLELKTAQGSLIAASRVGIIWQEAISGHRSQLLGLHALIAQGHPDVTPAVIEAIRLECRAALTALAGAAERFGRERKPRKTRKGKA